MTKSALFFSLIAIFGLFIFTGCNDDDATGNNNRIPLTYDADEHIYGTLGFTRETSWEVVIDPVSGQLDSIPGTNLFLPYNLPFGPRFFQDFNPDRRYLFNQDGDLMVQNLSSLQSEAFTTNTGINLTNPQFIARSRSADELIVMDSDQSLWRANLNDLSLSRWVDNLSPQDRQAVYVYQVGEGQLLIIYDNSGCANCATANMVNIINFEQDQILGFTELSGSTFGFVKHPERNEFYFLSFADNGFRLGSLSWDGSTLNERIISTENLAIDDLAGQRQTIHTASNTFIAVAPRGDLEMPETVLYRIDLTTGELVSEVALETGGHLFKIAGE